MQIKLIENFRAVFYAPFYAAEALGAYRAEGLDVVLTNARSAENSLQSMRAGVGNVSWGGPLRVLKGIDVDPGSGYVAFCEVVRRDPFFLLGRTPNAAFRVRDLVGKRVAVVTEVPTPWICLQLDLRQAAVSPDTITLAPSRTMAQNVAALAAGEVDVIQVFQPYAEALVESGQGHIWYSAASRGLTSYTTFNSTRRFLEENPEVGPGMTRAMYRTQKWIASHDGKALAELVGGYLADVPRARLAACFDRYQRLELWNTDPRINRAGVEWLRDAMYASGYIEKRHTFEMCTDTRFGDQAVRDDPPSL
jgi:NitT/TauT family transport system substrate-binding protein